MTSPSAAAIGIERIVAAAGREVLLESEAMEILRLLGIGIPAGEVVTSEQEAARLEIPGDRVVVKVLSPEVAHKTEVGGVAIVANTPRTIGGAVAAMAARVPAAEAYLVCEYVEHAPGPVGEILAGLRWTDAFGPVVTLGFGGVAAELLGDPLILSASGGRRGLEAALRGSRIGRLLAEGHRGAPPSIGTAELADLAGRLLAVGAEVMPEILVEIEANPLVFTPEGPVALDALARCGTGPIERPDPPRPGSGMKRILHPASIAVMGVSQRRNPGRMILDNVLAAGFPPDRVTVIKPGVDRIGGVRAVPDLEAVGDPVDLLVLAVAAEAVPGIVEQAILGRHARSMIVIPGGLGERAGSEDLAARIRRAVADSRESDWGGPVVNGGNSMGIRSVPGRYDATFIPAERMTPAPTAEAPLAVVAQSGAFTLSRLDRLPRVRPRYLVTVGNQLDLTVGDYVEHFAADPSVEIVACYVEGLRPGDGSRLLEAAGTLRERGGWLVLARGGKTGAGARSALTHTAAIATDDVVIRSLARGAGILEAGSLDEFEDLLRLTLALRAKPLAGLGVGAVSNAGFECVAMADAFGPLAPASLDPSSVERLTGLFAKAGLGGIVGVQNPLDMTPGADDETFAAAVEIMLDDPGVDVGVVGCVPYTASLLTLPDQIDRPGSVVQRLAALADHPTPWVVAVDAGARYDPAVAVLESAGLAVFRTVDRAVRLLGRYAAERRARSGVNR